MNQMRKCTLCCVLQSHTPINLPHNEPVIVGRNRETGIKAPELSRKQLELVANLKICTVKVKAMGINSSGANGFCLIKNKAYNLRHKDRLELVLDNYVHEIIFEPPPDDSEGETSFKRKSENSDEEQSSKKIKIAEAVVSGWEEIDKKLLIFTSKNVQSLNKIASYDLDGTIITTKSGARFPKDAEDWKFAFAEVPKKLKDLHNNNYKIVFFTNQAGIGLGKMKKTEFKSKIEKISNKLDLPIQVFASTGKGIYRKPAPGMWDSLSKNKHGGIRIDILNSFYCGDAAGREKNWAPKMKKDHSIGDRLFALNIGLPFKTPEEHFLNARPIPGKMPEFDPRNIKTLPLLEPKSSNLTFGKQEIIVVVGSPGSGKSHFCKNFLVPEGYVHVNRDKLGSWQKCVAAAEAALKNKSCVVVDNTNPDKESRKRYVSLAKKLSVPCRCFVLNTSIHQAKHNNCFREIIDDQHQIVTDIIINTYKKYYVEPTSEENFDEIVHVNCNPKFNNPDHERLYHMFLLEK